MPEPDVPSMQQIIHVHPEAPAKPMPGNTCNGCGVCCLAEPCPLGRVLSGRAHGGCDALQWTPDQHRYHCRALADPQGVWPWLPNVAVPLARRLAQRWISAAKGCDSDAELMA